MSNSEPSIDEIRRAIAAVPWDRLAHAYGGAQDAPQNLEVFLRARSANDDLEQAVEWLWSSVLHQENIYSAAPPVIWILLELLAARPDHPERASVLQAVQVVTDGLTYIGDSEESGQGADVEPFQRGGPGEPLYEVWTEKTLQASSDADEDDEAYFAAIHVTSRLLRELVRHAIPVIRQCLGSTDGRVRTAAIAAGLGALQVVPSDAKVFQGLIRVVGDTDYDPGAWVSVAMVFGELGHDLTAQLHHRDRRVRLAAAMGACPSHKKRCVPELVLALEEPDWLEEEFPNDAAHVDMYLRFHVLGRLLELTDASSADRQVLDALCTIIRKRASAWTVDVEWGPMLLWAFSDRVVDLPHQGQPAALPTVLTAAQAAILRCLCERDEFWEPSYGNAQAIYLRIQLPYDREVLCKLAQAH